MSHYRTVTSVAKPLVYVYPVPLIDVFCVLGSREVGKRVHCLRQHERILKFATVLKSTSKLGLLHSLSKLNAFLIY